MTVPERFPTLSVPEDQPALPQPLLAFCPARRSLIAVLRWAIPAMVAAAVLFGAGAPAGAFPGLDRPSVSIAAKRGSYGFGIDDVVFRLRRAGSADDAVSVRVSLSQDHLYLAADRLNARVRFAAGKREAELRIPASRFNGPATQSGALRATLDAGFGYTVGHPDSARTRMVAMDPAITVRPEQASYTVDPDDGAARVTFVARTASGLPRPGKGFSIAFSAQAASDDAIARAQTREVLRTIDFERGDFDAAGEEWEARKTVSISMEEGAGDLEVEYRRAASTPGRIRPRNSDGGACADDICMVPIFMAQRDGPTLTIAAERGSYGYGIDDIGFVITAAGTRDGAIEASVTLTQEDGYLERDALDRTVRIEPGETSARLVLTIQSQTLDAGRTGALTATIDAGDGYAVGTPASATARIVVLDPAITVRPERASYRFAEGQADARLAYVALTEPGLPKPSRGFDVLVVTSPYPGGASIPADLVYIHREVDFEPGDFILRDDGRWLARKEVALVIVDDGEAEPEESLNMLLLTSTTPPGVEIRQADGGECSGNLCLSSVTIVDDDGPALTGLAIAPVPPAASADHGPGYIKDEFLALPDDAVHGRGATLTFTLTLDAEVTVTGTPELVLDIFARERRARYTGGSGTDRLTFAWTVAKGDNDPDGLEFRSLDLNGGTIRDGEGRELRTESIPAQRFAEHRVRGGLHAMRLAVSGSAREGEPFEIRVIRDGGYDEVAVAGVGVADSFLPHIEASDQEAANGPGGRQMDFDHGAAGEPGVRVSTRTVTPPGDGVADASRTLTVRLTGTDAGFWSTPPLGDYRAWYLTDGPVEATVPVIDTGLPLAMAGLRVHGASAREAPGARLVFRVTLSPHSAAPVTVQYRTGDDPANAPGAVAGEDYVATEGMLTFEPGETGKTVEVEVLADDHDEGFETMRLFLSNADGARIDTGSALGVIRNSGPIPKAWIARFGRTVADQVLDAVESRMRAARRPGVEVAVAGRRIGAGSGSGGKPGGASARDLAGGTAFAATAEAGRGGYVSLWGRGAVTRFDGRDGGLALDGAVTSGMIGLDWSSGSRPGAWSAGLIVSRSAGEGGYRGNGAGRVEATLTGLYPWGRLALSDRVDGWAAAGYATGTLSVTPKKPGQAGDAATIRTGLDMRMAAAGLRGALVEGGRDGLALTGKTDATIVETESDAARGSDGGNLAAARATVTRLRFGVEGSRPFDLGDESVLTPGMEIGVRHDGGDAETGFGLDAGGGLAWASPRHGLRIELRGRGLLTHESDGFRERGFSGSLGWDPEPSSARGPSLRLNPTVGGPSSGGADALLAARPGSGGGEDPRHRRLEARFGYGFPAWGGRLASVPEIGLGLSDTGREYILGWRLTNEGPGTFRLSTEARRRESDADGATAEHRIGIRLSARW